MRKRKHSNWQARLFAAIATLTIAFVTVVIESRVVAQASQDEVEYGAVYDCGAGRSKFKVVSCEGDEDMDRCKVQTLRSPDPNSIVNEDNWYRKGVMDHIAAGCKPKNGPKRQSATETKNETPNETGTAKTQTPSASDGNRRKFKPGDRVKASPGMMEEDKYYQSCTVLKEMKPNAYYLMCDPHKGISFQDYTVREDFVRAWDNATPAPTFDCSFDQPPVVNTKTSAASAALFKRIIYEWQAVMNSKTRVGVTFETFQIGSPYKNVYANTKNALLHEGFPQNATIYPIKTRFVSCVEDKAWNYRGLFESVYNCAKNRFGEWSCGVGGVTRTLDKQHIPKK